MPLGEGAQSTLFKEARAGGGVMIVLHLLASFIHFIIYDWEFLDPITKTNIAGSRMVKRWFYRP